MRRLLLLGLLAPLASGCHSDRVSPTAPVNPVPRWVKVERLSHKAVRGAALFYSGGCTVCHRYAGTGTTRLGAPDLTAIGRRGLGIQFQIAHLKCPSCMIPGSPMPPSRALDHERLHQLAVFLEASKGIH